MFLNIGHYIAYSIIRLCVVILDGLMVTCLDNDQRFNSHEGHSCLFLYLSFSSSPFHIFTSLTTDLVILFTLSKLFLSLSFTLYQRESSSTLCVGFHILGAGDHI